MNNDFTWYDDKGSFTKSQWDNLLKLTPKEENCLFDDIDQTVPMGLVCTCPKHSFR